MNETILIFVSPYFEFSLHAKAVMAVRFSFVIERIKETLEWFQEEYNLLFFGSFSFNRRFLYTKQSVLV